MKLDIVNGKNETVGALELNDEVFGGRVKTDLIWESVVQQNAAERRGTHATKNRALVSGGGKKPYKQKGTGRAAGRSSRNAAVAQGRHGVRAAAAQLRVRPAEEGAARRAARGARAEAARRRRRRRRHARGRASGKTKATAEMLRGSAPPARRCVIDVKPDDGFALTARNIAGVKLVPTARVTARDVMDTSHVIATREALEKLQETLG